MPPLTEVLSLLVYEVLEELPWLGSFSIAHCIRYLKGHPPWVFYNWSVAGAGMWGERPQGWLHPLPMTQQYCLAATAVWHSSKGISTTLSSLTSPQVVSP